MALHPMITTGSPVGPPWSTNDPGAWQDIDGVTAQAGGGYYQLATGIFRGAADANGRLWGSAPGRVRGILLALLVESRPASIANDFAWADGDSWDGRSIQVNPDAGTTSGWRIRAVFKVGKA